MRKIKKIKKMVESKKKIVKVHAKKKNGINEFVKIWILLLKEGLGTFL